MQELLSALTMRLEASGERALLTALGYLAAMLLLIVAFVAVVYAGATAVSQVYGPVVAALCVAAGAVLMALVLILWLSHRRKVLAQQVLLQRAARSSALTSASAVALPIAMKASPLGTLVAVAAAAYVIAKASQRNE